MGWFSDLLSSDGADIEAQEVNIRQSFAQNAMGLMVDPSKAVDAIVSDIQQKFDAADPSQQGFMKQAFQNVCEANPVKLNYNQNHSGSIDRPNAALGGQSPRKAVCTQIASLGRR